jgi:ketosteroid isomerase-like protein
MTHNTNETQVRQLIESWALAVRTKNIDAILSHHSADLVMYDVPPPFQSVGLDAYRETWKTFFEGTELGTFDIEELNVIAGDDVAFCYARMFCMTKNSDNGYYRLDFRLTVGLKKINNKWIIVHEHHSIPASD